jgi:hypothetical protein
MLLFLFAFSNFSNKVLCFCVSGITRMSHHTWLAPWASLLTFFPGDGFKLWSASQVAGIIDMSQHDLLDLHYQLSFFSLTESIHSFISSRFHMAASLVGIAKAPGNFSWNVEGLCILWRKWLCPDMEPAHLHLPSNNGTIRVRQI